MVALKLCWHSSGPVRASTQNHKSFALFQKVWIFFFLVPIMVICLRYHCGGTRKTTSTTAKILEQLIVFYTLQIEES